MEHVGDGCLAGQIREQVVANFVSGDGMVIATSYLCAKVHVEQVKELVDLVR